MPEEHLMSIAKLCATCAVLCIVPILTIVQCRKKKATDGNKSPPPGHLPEFVQPDKKEAESLYGIESRVAFPPKDAEQRNGEGNGASQPAVADVPAKV